MRTAESSDLADSIDIDTVRAVLRQHPVELAILFGSRARGDVHSTSDVDIAVEFDGLRPTDDGYNDAFLGLGADLSDALGTDSVDLVDLQAVSPALADSIFEHGLILFGDSAHAAELRGQSTTTDAETRSPRDRFDAALARIDAHLDGTDDTPAPAAGQSEDDG